MRAFNSALLKPQSVGVTPVSFDIGDASAAVYQTAGSNLADISAFGLSCAGLDLLTCPSPPTTLAQMHSVSYSSSKFALPVTNGTYNIYIIAFADNDSRRTLTCKVDGVTKFTDFFPYVDAGNTQKAIARMIPAYAVTGGSCEVEITASGGAGYDAWSFIVFG